MEVFTLIFLAIYLGVTDASISPLRYFKLTAQNEMSYFSSIPSTPDYKYSVKYFGQRVDHFNYVNKRLRFRQRYVISEEHWCECCPIFLYLGNEGDIMYFVNNTGYMWEIAPKFSAMVIFVEHRYYGQSFPFGKFDTRPDRIGYLTTGQVLHKRSQKSINYYYLGSGRFH